VEGTFPVPFILPFRASVLHHVVEDTSAVFSLESIIGFHKMEGTPEGALVSVAELCLPLPHTLLDQLNFFLC